MALVRMVNGIADSSQKGKVAASVASLASSAGLPRILVDLRHESTHNELPSISALRLAAHHALAWLQTNYWHRQEEQLRTSQDRITTILCQYMASHVAAASKSSLSEAQRQSVDSAEEEQVHTGGPPLIHPEVAASAAKYDAAAARRQRQTLLNELRSLVPQPSAGSLVEGALSAEREAAGNEMMSPEAVATALRHAFKHVDPEWPQLRVLILEELSKRIFSAAEDELLGQMLEVWSRTLFGATECPAVEAFIDRASAQLASTAMGSYAEVEASGRLLNRENTSAVVGFIEGLVNRIPEGDSSLKEHYQTMLTTLSKSQGFDQSLPPAMGGWTSSKDSKDILEIQRKELVEAEARQAELLGGPRQRKRNSQPTASPDAVRWKRTKNWHACALGMLPSFINPNGKLPRLDTVLFGPQAKVEKQNGADPGRRQQPSAAAAAAAARGSDAALVPRATAISLLQQPVSNNEIGDPRRMGVQEERGRDGRALGSRSARCAPPPRVIALI